MDNEDVRYFHKIMVDQAYENLHFWLEEAKKEGVEVEDYRLVIENMERLIEAQKPREEQIL